MGEKDWGVSEKEVRRIQKEAANKVQARHEAIRRELKEKKQQKDFREFGEYRGLGKGDLTRAYRAKK